MCQVTDTILEFLYMCGFFFSRKNKKETHMEKGFWALLTVWEKRWLPLLLSISVTMTGDGGENDFSFCGDALLWWITLCCRLLAGPVSLAYVSHVPQGGCHIITLCACVCTYVCVYVCVCVLFQWGICHPCSLNRGGQRTAVVSLWSWCPFRGAEQDGTGSNKGWHPWHSF